MGCVHRSPSAKLFAWCSDENWSIIESFRLSFHSSISELTIGQFVCVCECCLEPVNGPTTNVLDLLRVIFRSFQLRNASNRLAHHTNEPTIRNEQYKKKIWENNVEIYCILAHGRRQANWRMFIVCCQSAFYETQKCMAAIVIVCAGSNFSIPILYLFSVHHNIRMWTNRKCVHDKHWLTRIVLRMEFFLSLMATMKNCTESAHFACYCLVLCSAYIYWQMGSIIFLLIAIYIQGEMMRDTRKAGQQWAIAIRMIIMNNIFADS